METASKKITDTTSRLSQMEATGDFSELEDLISGDKNSISSFLAAPVELKTNKVYPIENYGSSMRSILLYTFHLDRRNCPGCHAQGHCIRKTAPPGLNI
ncbi:MAG: hypothetical protein ACLR2O_10515 [Coprococcus sp.]